MAVITDQEDLFPNFNTSVVYNEDVESKTDDKYLYYGVPIVLTFTILLLIIMLMALVGNILVITTILRNKNMRTRTNILLCNLAVADILVAILDIPIAITTLNFGKWPFSKHLCYFNGYLVGLGLMLSIHTLMWISIHKFISITRPLKRSMTPGKIFCMIFAAWGWALIYNLAPIFGWSETVYKAGASQCGPIVPTTPLQKSHSWTNTLCNFIIPVCVMSYCYYKIFAEVKDHMNRLQDFSDTTMIMTIIQQKRITKTLVIVFVCFILCWSPYICYSCFLVFLGEDRVNPIFNPLAYLATYLNSACNPIIYGLRSPSFRRGFKDILSGCRDVPGSPMASESFKWTRVNGFMISFRRSLIRSRSTPEFVSQKNKSKKKVQKKNSTGTNEPLLKSYLHRRVNTLPKIKFEDKKVLPVDNVSPAEGSSEPHLQTSLERLNSVQSTVSPMASVSSPLIKVNSEELCNDSEENSERSDIFFGTPSPRDTDKKYFIYLPKLNRFNPLSVSAPNLLANSDQNGVDVGVRSVDTATKTNFLNLPQSSPLRASSVGNVKPSLDVESQHLSKIPRKEFPKLVWQASLENLSPDHGKLMPLQPQGFGRLKPNIPTIVTSVENICNSILITRSSCSISSQKKDSGQGRDDIFYTDASVTELHSEQDASVLISRL